MASKKKWRQRYYDAAYANLHEVQKLEACIREKDRVIEQLKTEVSNDR